MILIWYWDCRKVVNSQTNMHLVQATYLLHYLQNDSLMRVNVLSYCIYISLLFSTVGILPGGFYLRTKSAAPWNCRVLLGQVYVIVVRLMVRGHFDHMSLTSYSLSTDGFCPLVFHNYIYKATVDNFYVKDNDDSL